MSNGYPLSAGRATSAFSIGEIKELLVLAEPGRSSCTEVQTLTAAHLGKVRAKIADLSKLEAILAGAVERCLVEPAPACPVLGMLASPRIPESVRSRRD